MTKVGSTPLGLPTSRMRNGATAGTAACTGMVLGCFALWWVNSRTPVCTEIAAFWLLVILGLGCVISTVVAIVTHSWWWIIATIVALLFLMQVYGTWVDC
jgi:hypothetical protein